MLDQIFGRLFLSQWIVFAVLLVLLVGLSELAWRMGLACSGKKSEADKESGTVRSAVLALLGLLLGFSFALAGARHETRRELLVEEANSIVTTARRAQLLSEPHAANVVQLLREYVPLRIEAHREAQSYDQFATTRKRSAELQDRMWAEAVAAADFSRRNKNCVYLLNYEDARNAMSRGSQLADCSSGCLRQSFQKQDHLRRRSSS